MRTALLLTAVVLAGCGAGGAVRAAAPAEPRTLELDWLEEWPEAGLVFRVHRLVIRRDGWLVTASVANRSSADYAIRWPHHRGKSMFGLVLLKTVTRKELRELTADFMKAPPFLEPDRIAPPLPSILSAGSSWRGTMTGSRALRKGSAVRILFGRFDRTRGHPGFRLWITNHAVRL
jgi:hypothetical protein